MGFLIAIIVLGLAWAGSYLWLNRAFATLVKTSNPEGLAGRALVVDHPGRGSFHVQVVSGYVEGLLSAGWRVDRTTASRETPVDLSGVDLLVLGTPTYWFSPSWPIRRYLRRVGDLGGQHTVTLVTGMGAAARSAAALERRVRQAHGHLVEGLLYYRMRPNDHDNYVDTAQNKALAVRMAAQAAQALSLSVQDAGDGEPV
jgi:hypothetical protein